MEDAAGQANKNANMNENWIFSVAVHVEEKYILTEIERNFRMKKKTLAKIEKSMKWTSG